MNYDVLLNTRSLKDLSQQERPSFRLEDQLARAGIQHAGAVIPAEDP